VEVQSVFDRPTPGVTAGLGAPECMDAHTSPVPDLPGSDPAGRTSRHRARAFLAQVEAILRRLPVDVEVTYAKL
jgi:hypothetical protein